MNRVTIEKITLTAQLVLSLVLILGFFGALYIAWFSDSAIADARLRIIDTMVGALGTMVMAVVTYWFARQRNASADKPADQ